MMAERYTAMRLIGSASGRSHLSSALLQEINWLVGT